MRSLLRLLSAVIMGAVAVVGALVAVPVAVQGLWRHAATSTASPIAPLSEVTSTGSTVYAADGTVLAVLHSSVTRLPVPLSKVPKVLVTALLDTEDHYFYVHGAIDYKSELRALLHDAGGGGLQGGSDITQQLVKNVYLTDQRTITRKLKEAFIASRLLHMYSKNQILDAYLNTVYLGSGAYGMAAAAQAYWGEPIQKVTLPQAALLAGLVQNPSAYDPVANPVAARIRRSEVLGRMRFYHDITAAQYAAADAAPLPTRVAVTQTAPSGIDGYYVQQVEDQLLGPTSPLGGTPSSRYAAVFDGGLKIYTNLDPALQADAEAAVTAVTPPNTAGYKEALVSIQPSTGDVRALIAGQHYSPANSFDVVTQGRRQPGSGFKLFTIVPALEQGDSIFDPVEASSPCPIPFPGNNSYVKTPAHNDVGDGQQGVVTVQDATALSLNCAYLRMAHQVGLAAVVHTAEQFGIPASEMKPVIGDPSLVLGSAGVSQLQMSAAYAALADNGVYHAPQFINRVVDRTGSVIYAQPTAGRRVVPANLVGQADAAFQSVVQYGTGTAAAIPGRPVAGKTGTNNGPTDAWFNGFTPQLESTVWMGDPRSEAHQVVIGGALVYGGMYPAQTVHDFLAAALASSPVQQFPAIDTAAVAPSQFIPVVTGPTPTVLPVLQGGGFPGAAGSGSAAGSGLSGSGSAAGSGLSGNGSAAASGLSGSGVSGSGASGSGTGTGVSGAGTPTGAGAGGSGTGSGAGAGGAGAGGAGGGAPGGGAGGTTGTTVPSSTGTAAPPTTTPATTATTAATTGAPSPGTTAAPAPAVTSGNGTG